MKGDTREGTKRVQHYRWPPARPAAACPRVYPGREQLWSFTVPPGARNAGVVAEGAVVPQILLARDENRLAGEPALPSNGNPYLESYGRFERVSGLLVPAPGRYFVVVETRPGHKPGPYRLRLWVDDRTPPDVSAITRVPAGELRFRVTDARQRRERPDVVVRVDASQQDVTVSATGRCASASAASSRAATASRSPPRTCRRRRTPRTPRRSRCRTRAPCTRRSPWAEPASLRRDGSLRASGQGAVRPLRHPRLGRGASRARPRRRGRRPPSSAARSSSRRRC